MTEKDYPIGRLLRSGITGFVAGCPIVDKEVPRFGQLVRVSLGAVENAQHSPKDVGSIDILGIVHEISIIDDGLVRQLVTRDQQVDATVIADNRTNRTVPMEISVLAVGYRRADAVYHSLPPRAPLSLDTIHQCSDAEIVAFTNAGRFGYLRHLLRNPDLPVAELVAAHIAQAAAAHSAAGDKDWRTRASQEIIALLRDDYQILMQVLGALADAA